MIDPVSQIVQLLRPSPTVSKMVSGAGKWRVRRTNVNSPFYCAQLRGTTRFEFEGRPPRDLTAGEFLLIPAPFEFTACSLETPAEADETPPSVLRGGEVRHGDPDAPADLQMLIGHCELDSPHASLLISLLPREVFVQGESRLGTIVELVRDESLGQRPGREVILSRLLEVLFIEALRSTTTTSASAGLLCGLADERVAVTLHRIHERPAQRWTVTALAKEAALSRSALHDRFRRAVGTTPMAYLLGWRMALAAEYLRRQSPVAEVAERVGYASSSTFSAAFRRHVGLPPTEFASAHARASVPQAAKTVRTPTGHGLQHGLDVSTGHRALSSRDHGLPPRQTR